MDKHTLCRGRLKFERMQAKEAGLKPFRMKSSKIAPDQYAVFVDDGFWKRANPAYWKRFDYQEVEACCAFDARATVICDLIAWHKEN